MFLQHFKLTCPPFAERLPAADLWPDDRLLAGIVRLRQVLGPTTIGLLTGASGIGKSALLKRFIQEVDGPQCKVCYLHLTHLTSSSLLKMLVSKLGETPRRGKERLFEQILAKARQANGTLLLILDEAHLLDSDGLIDLRLLVSSALDDAPPLRLILAGQETLRHTLQQSAHQALLGRIGVAYQLHPFAREQTLAYLDYCVEKAGGSDKLFETAVKTTLHEYSGGVPRLINRLGMACLLQAFEAKQTRVTAAVLHEALNDFQIAP